MAEEVKKPTEAAAEKPEASAAADANIEASKKGIAEVQEEQLKTCTAKLQTEKPDVRNLLNPSTFSTVNDKLGGNCNATDRLADLHTELTPQNDKQQIKVETHPDGTRLESRFENGKMVAQRSVRGDTRTLRTYDENGNLGTTVTESGLGDKLQQTWTFADGDKLVVRANGTFAGEINGRRVEGAGRAQIEALIKQALDDQSFVPDVGKNSLGTDLHGSAFVTMGDLRTGAIVMRNGDLNVIDRNGAGDPHRNVVNFSGDTMVLKGPNGAETTIKAQSHENGMYTFIHGGMTFKVQDGKVKEIAADRGDLKQTISNDGTGWKSQAIEKRFDSSGAALPDFKATSRTTEPGAGEIQVSIGDQPQTTTVVTPKERITYNGDGSDRSAKNVVMRTTDNSISTNDVTREGNRMYDATGVYSDKDPYAKGGVFYDVVSGRNLSESQLLQFASFAASMSNQVGSFQSFFEGVSKGANYMLSSVEAKISQIQNFMGYVNCNVNGSRFLHLLPMANKALESGYCARDRAGVVAPETATIAHGFPQTEINPVRAQDVTTPKMALIKGGEEYREENENKDKNKNQLPNLILFRKA